MQIRVIKIIRPGLKNKISQMKSRNILLIHASNKVINKKDNIHSKESLVPSLGIAMIAASLRNRGFFPTIFDLRLPHRSMKDILRYVKKENPLFIGIGAFTNEIVQSGECARIIKINFPTVPILIGGPHSTIMPKETLEEFEHFDIAVIGEGEKTVIDLAEMMYKRKNNLEKLENIAFKKNGRIIIKSNPNLFINNLDELPFPAWDLFEFKYYNKIFVVSTSRGCPFQCYFCSPLYLGKKVRLRSAEKVVEEIEYIAKNFGAKRIQFTDAAFGLSREITEKICDLIIKKGLSKRIEWDCETRADKLDEKILQKMKKAGCKCIAIGVESGNNRILTEVIKKGETKEQIKKGVKLVKKSGIKLRCFFIFGHYTESEKEMKETIKFALELNPDSLSFGLLVPNPGSEVRRMAEKGLGGMKILNNNWNNYNQFDYNCYEKEDMPLMELKRWQAKAYWIFYFYHPLKGLSLFFEGSSYNYNIKSLITIPIQLLKRILS